MKIDHIDVRQILDSRGLPTVEVDVWLESGVFGRAAVPSGASTGSHEALELRDGDDAFGGKGVQKALANIKETIEPLVKGKMADDQFMIDQLMIDADGTENKSNLGANAMLAVSLAVAHAAAAERRILLYKHINDIAGNPQMSLPMPMMNLLNGGRHASSSSDFQEFMLIPAGAETMQQAVRMGSEIFHQLKKIIGADNVSTAVGDEGGFTYPLKSSNTEMLDLLFMASEQAGYEPGIDFMFAMDVAASEFYSDGEYFMKAENRSLTSEEMIAYLTGITQSYPVSSIEDGLAEDDWEGWQTLTSVLDGVQIVGDDLLVTNVERLQKAIDMKAANAILIKPNQIGTLTETLKAIKLAQENGLKSIVSHRSGETEDVTITHIAIGTGAGQIKTGSMSRGERTAKYNELLRLEAIDDTLRLTQPF